MRASKFSIEKLLKVYALIQTGVTVKEACLRGKISPATFYSWRRILHITLLSQNNSFVEQLAFKETSRTQRKVADSKEKKDFPLIKNQSIPEEEIKLLNLLAQIIVDIIIREDGK